jgi:phosphate starvation-inducible protein PhoH
VDEAQNMNSMELHTIMTRIGENSKIIFCGDTNQDDLTSERYKEFSGLASFAEVLYTMKEFEHIHFTQDDIVRSDIVRSYIIARERLVA